MGDLEYIRNITAIEQITWLDRMLCIPLVRLLRELLKASNDACMRSQNLAANVL
ncbi:MAG TPA: hypothetical protein GXX69_10245 [Firmicutes bacterium]|nr:hypothetical protein [Bacillota bacterium]